MAPGCAKTAPGWIDADDPPVWLQPIAMAAARNAFEGRKDIIASDSDQVPAAFSNLHTMVNRHVKPVADYPQIKGGVSYVLVCETTHLCNYGLHILLKTSEAARRRGGSNTTFEGITLETVVEVLMEAGVRAIAQDPDEQWSVASSFFAASERGEKSIRKVAP